jgi:hypothetical protein
MRPILAILLGLAILGGARAQATLPGFPAWLCGPDVAPLVCYAEGLSAPPVVAVAGAAGGLSNCEDDGAGGLRCVLWAGAGWTRVEADGVTVAARCPCRVYLAEVGR